MAPKRKASAVPEAESVIDAPHSSKKSKAKSPASKDTSSQYLTIGRPQWDFEREYGDEEEIPEDDFRAQAQYHRKDPSAFPEWKWLMSKRAQDINARDMLEQQKRNQDQWVMYISNDFNGYGFQELVENQLQRWYDAYVKRDVRETFFRMEALAHFLVEEDLMEWMGQDDGPRLQLTTTLLVRAFLTTLHLLHKHGLFRPDSELKSLRTCINAFLQFLEDADTETYFEEPGKADEAPAIVKGYCIKNDFDYELAYDIRKFVESRDVPEDLDVDDPSDDPFDLEETLNGMIKQYGQGSPKKLGGTTYDITKMSSAERKRYSFDKNDPMQEMLDQLVGAEREVQGGEVPID